MTPGILSYGFACFTISLLLLQLSFTGDRNSRNTPLIIALFASLLWAVFYVLMTVRPAPILIASGVPDSLRILAWAGFVNSLLITNKVLEKRSKWTFSVKHSGTSKLLYGSAAIVVVQISLVITILLDWMPSAIVSIALPVSWTIPPLLFLLLLERFYMATKNRLLCLALGATAAYDFYLFSNTLLFRQISLDNWQARGYLYGIIVPFVAYTAARNPQWSIQLHVSRRVVTSSATLLIAGIYLLATAFAASLINLDRFEGATLIQITFVLLAIVMLLAIVSSSKFRAKCRVFISKNFFNFKYDYRHEWLKFTKKLSAQIDDTPEAVLQGLCDIVDSDAGEIWVKAKSDKYQCVGNRGSHKVEGHRLLARDVEPIIEFLKNTHWLIDVDEYQKYPDRYEGLALPSRSFLHGRVWLIVPLPFRQDIVGFVLIDRSNIVKSINWEDRDLLKTAGHQAAGLIAQQITHQALKEAGQFDAFNRLSAYIVHDLKNILGQQSLIISNAEKHKSNPEFVDDVIATIENSVQRMQKLLEQLREPDIPPPLSTINLTILLSDVVKQKSASTPIPSFSRTSEQTNLNVMADSDKLERVFGHLIQNAQEATETSGSVDIDISANNEFAWVKIVDTGTGMSEQFMNQRLFRAFESTKGLTGMGIGLFESREYIEQLGGNITVTSKEGHGSCFVIQLPLIT